MTDYGKKQTGLDQYAIQKFAAAFEIIPRMLAENSGLNATDVIANLYAAHAAGNSKAGAPRGLAPPLACTSQARQRHCPPLRQPHLCPPSLDVYLVSSMQ